MNQDLAEYLDFPAQDISDDPDKMMVNFTIRKGERGVNFKDYMTKEEIYQVEDKLAHDPSVEYFVVSYCGITDVYQR